MQETVRGERERAARRKATGEVRHAAAGFGDDRRRRREVPDADAEVEHRLRGALSDEDVSPENAEATVPDALPDGRDRQWTLLVERAQGPETGVRLLDARDRGDADRALVRRWGFNVISVLTERARQGAANRCDRR